MSAEPFKPYFLMRDVASVNTPVYNVPLFSYEVVPKISYSDGIQTVSDIVSLLLVFAS